MEHWLEQLSVTLQQTDSVVMITVIAVDGSVPRHPGAKMLVSSSGQAGTIGGGHLEFKATQLARDLLGGRTTAPVRRTYHLGPGLGQCCGGRVELLLEHINQSNSPHRWSGVIAVRRAINTQVTKFEAVPAPDINSNRDNNVLALSQVGTEIFLTEQIRRPAQVWVFGAGHVGAAVVNQLSLLPCRVRLLDEREQSFAQTIADGVEVCCCDSVVDEIADAPDDVCFVVMTHSHALDFELCLAMLQRPFAYLGLIGSASKRAAFEKRLSARGISAARLGQLVCPIGSGNIQSKAPYAIAVSLAMQLMSLWNMAGNDQNNDKPL
ncbi:MAG: xanthine dehydrogenase accessory protein XdhC [Pseudomonadota bacterium]